MNDSSYVKFLRSVETKELLKKPNAFILLAQIALRARRTDSFNVNRLKHGEAFIGDFREIGLSRQNYRTALQQLVKWEFVTTKATNKGTIVKLTNSDVFDINIEPGNHQSNQQLTGKPPTANRQVTSNKNDKKEKNVNNDNYEKSKYNYKSNKNRFKIESKPDYTEEF